MDQTTWVCIRPRYLDEYENVNDVDFASTHASRCKVVKLTHRRFGFSFIEILIVVTILGIVTSLVIPTVSNTDVTRVRSAAQMLLADLQYAQIESIAHGDDGRVVVFNSTTNTYHIGTASAPDTPIDYPAGGGPYSTQYGSGRAYHLEGVTINGFSLGGDNELGFGIYGQLDQTTPATITLGAGANTITISLDPPTGEITVGPIM